MTYVWQKSQSSPSGKKAGFFGLYVFCLWESMSELRPYLQEIEDLDPAVLKAAKKIHECFLSYSGGPQQYAVAVAYASADCRAETRSLRKWVQKLTGERTKK